MRSFFIEGDLVAYATLTPAASGSPEATRASLRRLVLPLMALFLLAACGLQPLHGASQRAGQKVDLSTLTIDVSGTNITPDVGGNTPTTPRRYSELLKAEIADQVNPGGTRSAKQFRLAITYTEQQNSLFVNPDGTASRGDLVLVSSYTLTRLADATVVNAGDLQRISSYNTSPTADYASYVSIEDARKRAITELAQDYKLRLAALLPTLNNPNAGAHVAAPAEAVPVLQPIRTHETLRPGY